MKGDRVQDKAGFTGTVTDDSDAVTLCEIEVSWDISGCATMISINDVAPMQPGQDDKHIQEKLHAEIFGVEE